MSKQPSIKKNYVYNLLYQILCLITPLITVPYVSRVLGPDGVGTYSFSLSVLTYFTLLAALGVQSYGAREISRTRDNKPESSRLFWELVTMVVTTTVICCVIWICISITVSNYTVYFFALLPFLIAVPFDISWFYIGLEKMGHVVLRNSAVKILGMLLLFTLVHSPDDLIIYMLINSCVQFAGNISMWVTLPGLVASPRIRKKALLKHLKESLIYFVPALATSLYTVLDKTLIGVITGDAFQNGYYEQADKIIRMAMTLAFTSVNIVLGARLAYLFEIGKRTEAHERALRSLDFILLLCFAFSFGIASVAEVFVPVFFGEGYEPVVMLLWFMCPLVLIVGFSNCLGCQYYTPSGRRAQSARYIVIGAICNVVLSLTLIPLLGMYGAVIGSTVAEIIITLLYIAKCEGFITWHDVWNRAWKRLLIATVAFLSAFLLGRFLILSPIVTLACQIVVFILVYITLLALSRDTMLFQLFGIAQKTLKKTRLK